MNNTNMRSRCVILLGFLLSLSCNTKGQTSAEVVEDFYEEKIAFFTDWWHNPAMRFHFPLQQFTDVSLSLLEQDNEAFATQKGTDSNGFYFRANSFYRDTTQLYYGKATYKKWNKEGYNWNTVADVDLLQPYIVADTIGGKMYSEQYFFLGGYAKRFSQLGIGAFASYRAATAYKKKDPRPNNTVSDLKVNGGFSWAMSSKYTLGFHCNFNKYQQDQNVRIYKDGGGAALFYLRGLGIADERFSTVITDNSSPANKYKKNIYGATLSLFPTHRNGFLGTFSFFDNHLKLLKYNGKVLIDISGLETQRMKVSVGYKFSIQNIGFLVKAYGEHKENKGKEYIYKQNMTLLSTSEKYKNTIYIVGGEALVNYRKGKRNSLTRINVFYHNSEEQYAGLRAATSSAKEVQNITADLQENLLWNFDRSSLLTKIRLSYRHNLNKKLKTGTLTANSGKETLVLPDYFFATAKCIAGQLTLRYDYQLTAKYRVYAKGVFGYGDYKNVGNRKEYLLSVGMAF